MHVDVCVCICVGQILCMCVRKKLGSLQLKEHVNVSFSQCVRVQVCSLFLCVSVSRGQQKGMPQFETCQ